MQRLEQIRSGRPVRSDNPLVAGKSPTSPRGLAGEAALEGTFVPRKVSRSINQRRENRHHGVAGIVMVSCEGGETEAQVINVSECGLLIDAPITPGIGDKIDVRFENCEPLQASVIWRKGYRVGLDFGRPMIDLFPAD